MEPGQDVLAVLPGACLRGPDPHDDLRGGYTLASASDPSQAVQLKPGANSVTLNPGNASPLK